MHELTGTCLLHSPAALREHACKARALYAKQFAWLASTCSFQPKGCSVNSNTFHLSAHVSSLTAVAHARCRATSCDSQLRMSGKAYISQGVLQNQTWQFLAAMSKVLLHCSRFDPSARILLAAPRLFTHS